MPLEIHFNPSSFDKSRENLFHLYRSSNHKIQICLRLLRAYFNLDSVLPNAPFNAEVFLNSLSLKHLVFQYITSIWEQRTITRWFLILTVTMATMNTPWFCIQQEVCYGPVKEELRCDYVLLLHLHWRLFCLQIFHESLLISSDVVIGSYEHRTFSQIPETYLNEISQTIVLLCVTVLAMLIQQTPFELFKTFSLAFILL